MTIHVEPGSPIPTIPYAISQLGDKGGIIIVESGEYDINSSDDVAFLPSNITIRGRGASSVIKVNSVWNAAFKNVAPIKHLAISDLQLRIATPGENTYTGNLVNLSRVNDVNLENIRIDADNSQIGSKGEIKITNTGIFLDSCNGARIRDCKASGVFMAYYMQNCQWGRIQDNDAEGCFCNCFVNASEHIKITDNFFHDSLYTGPAGGLHALLEGSDGVLAMDSKYLTISSNHLVNNSEHGLYLSGCTGCVENGNIILGNGEQGMQIRYSGTPDNPGYDQGHTITGNLMAENGKRYPNDLYHGIGIYDYSLNHTIVGDTICNNGALGVRALGKGSDKLTLVGCTITGNGEKAQVSVEPDYLKYVLAHNLISDSANREF